MEDLKTQTIEESPDVGEVQETEDDSQSYNGPMSSETSSRLLAAYVAISDETEDVGHLLTNFLSITNSFNYAMVISNEVNSRQGKMRFIYSDDERELMKHAYDPDINPNVDESMEKLFIYMIDTYLNFHSNIEGLSENSNTYKYHVNAVKTVLIMLFKNNQYGIIVKLHIPEWAKGWVNNAIESVNDRQEEVYFEWLTYLSENESNDLVDIVKSVGQDFFKVNKAINTFHKYFRDKVTTMNNYDQTYEKFKELRDEYIKASTNITQRSLYPIFETTDDTFNKRKKVVINEFQEMFKNDEHTILIRRLIFGKSNEDEEREEFRKLLANKEPVTE